LLLLLIIIFAWALVLVFVAWFALKTECSFLSRGPLAAIWHKLWHVTGIWAQKPTLCALAIALTVVALRLLALPFLPVPEPRVHDEVSYLLAAETFASGHLTNAPHQLWPFFEFEHILVKPTYMSKYPPAQGLLLACGMLMGHSWIAVLLSFGCMCAAIFWMARAFQPTRWAMLAALLPLAYPGIASYWCNSYWGGTIAASAAALVFGACARLSHGLTLRNCLVLAAGMILVLNSRPFEGLVAVLVPLSFLLNWLFVSRRAEKTAVKITAIVAPLAILLTAFAAMLYSNHCITGSALQLPYAAYHRQYSRLPLWLGLPLGTEPLVFNNPQLQAFALDELQKFNKLQSPSGWLDCMLNERLVTAFNFFIGIWFVPLAGAALLSLSDRRMRVLWLSVAAVTLALGTEVYFQRHYLAPMAPPLYVLLVQGFRHLRLLKMKDLPVGLAIARLILTLIFFGFVYGLVILPETGKKQRELYQAFPGPRNKIMKMLSALPGKHLVIVRYAPHHDTGCEYVYDNADIDASKVVWARDLGAKNHQLLTYYRVRKVWFLQADAAPEPRLCDFNDAAVAK